VPDASATDVRKIASSGWRDGALDRSEAWSPAARCRCGGLCRSAWPSAAIAGLLAILGPGCAAHTEQTLSLGVGVLQTSGEPERVAQQSLRYVRCPYFPQDEPLGGRSSIRTVVVLGSACVVKPIAPLPNRRQPWVTSAAVPETTCTLQFDEGTRTINVATVVLNRDGVVLTGSDATTGRQALYRFTPTGSVAGTATGSFADEDQLCEVR
jgi:hypothetical protein